MPHSDDRELPSEWTVLLYTGPSSAVKDREMIEALFKEVRPQKDVCFAYQLNGYDHSARGAITKDRSAQRLSVSPPVDVTEPEALAAFVDWAQALCPSRSTALVVKDHGTGWGPPKGVSKLDILDYNGRYMSTPGIRSAIERTKSGHVDVYGFDSCTMSTVEVAHEVRNVASFFVATPEPAFTAGWPYARILELLGQRSEPLCPRDFIRRVIPLLNDSALAPFAGVELSWMDRLKDVIDVAAKDLLPWLPESKRKSHPLNIERMMDGPEGGTGEAYDILKVLAYFLQVFEGAPVEAFAAVETCLASAIVAPQLTPPAAKSGLSIFFPNATGSRAFASYGSVSFARKNHWTELISGINQSYLKASGPPAPRERNSKP